VTPNFSQAAAGAQVEVDLETGTVRLLDLRSETWAGRVINPVLAELQGEGNMAFGVGQALFEEIVLDAGQIVNPSLADYQLPSILDMGPSWSAGIHEASDGTGRVHGLGEAAAAAVPAAIGNAVADAIGISIYELPLRPERILRAIRERAVEAARAPAALATTPTAEVPHDDDGLPFERDGASMPRRDKARRPPETIPDAIVRFPNSWGKIARTWLDESGG